MARNIPSPVVKSFLNFFLVISKFWKIKDAEGNICSGAFIYEPICDVLRNLIPFVQFKKREKHPWRSVHFSKVTGF